MTHAQEQMLASPACGSDEQIMAMIREHESSVKTADICRKYGLSDATFYKLKRLLAEAMLDNAALKDLASKNF